MSPYAACIWLVAVLYCRYVGTLHNEYGRQLLDAVALAMDEFHFDGIYLDESSYGVSPLDFSPVATPVDFGLAALHCDHTGCSTIRHLTCGLKSVTLFTLVPEFANHPPGPFVAIFSSLQTTIRGTHIDTLNISHR
jgi:hypothetical protein